AVISLFQSLPALVEARLHGFTKLTKRSFDAALMYCSNLRVLAITGGTGSLGSDTLRSLIPFDGPLRDVSLTGRNLRFIDLSFQNIDDMLARDVTALP
ncbi:6191_t:CDS:2, partial [Acaulospora colombiana]